MPGTLLALVLSASPCAAQTQRIIPIKGGPGVQLAPALGDASLPLPDTLPLSDLSMMSVVQPPIPSPSQETVSAIPSSISPTEAAVLANPASDPVKNRTDEKTPPAPEQVLAGAAAAMAAEHPPLDKVFDNSGKQAPYESVYPSPWMAYREFKGPSAKPVEPGPSAQKFGPEPLPTRAEFLSITHDLYSHRVLSDAARARLAAAVNSARSLADIGFLEELAYLSLHDAKTRGLATQALRSFPLDEHAVFAVGNEIIHNARMLAFPDIERKKMAEDLRSKAGRYASAADQTLERILLQGSLFDPEFIRTERERAKARTTVAFDLEGTWAHYHPETGWTLLPGIEAEFQKLQANGVRLVLWTLASSREVRELFRQHPTLLDYFDLAIMGDNHLIYVADHFDSLKDAYAGADWAKVTEYYHGSFEKGSLLTKDISLFGYALIVDNDIFPGAENSPLGRYRAYRTKYFMRGQDGEDTRKFADRILGMLKHPPMDAPVPASPKDIPEILALFKATGFQMSDGGEAAYRRKLSFDPDSILVLKQDGKILGAAETVYDPWASFIRRIAVDPKHQKQGLGHALAEEAERRLKARGTTSVNSYVTRSREAPLRFFQQRGYAALPTEVISMEKPPSSALRPAAAGVRDARPEDLPKLIELVKAVGLFWEMGDNEEVYRKKLEFDPSSIVVVEVDGRVVGMGMTLYDPLGSFIWHGAVDPEYQRRGLGRLLLEERERRLLARGTTGISAYVLPTNTRSLSILGKRGYNRAPSPLTAVEKPLP